MVEKVSAGQSTRRRVNIVPHTHWDREWYAPFQTFRMRLVDVLDDLLPRLDADPSYAHFMLDGQMAVIDDYLAIRPEAEATIRRLTASGRLSIGPWYILMDEFLVSGETMIRNLQRGLGRAAAFGGAMEVGYLPDMFGHIAQMPQLLAQFGFAHAVVWRGVPEAVNRSGFWWQALDGSTVRAEYLPQGYGNGSSTPEDAKALLARIRDFESDWGDLLTGPILWMNGTDHEAPQPWLGRVVTEVNDLDAGYHLEVASLTSYLESAPTEGLPTWTGELRSGARANLLFGVGSNRVDVKVAAARAERGLEQIAEPLAALYQPADRWPSALLGEAWDHVIRNSAHDSICACSHDDVCTAVLHRFAEATHIAEGVADRAVAALAARLQGNQPVLVNPSARPRSGIVTVQIPGNDVHPGTQVLRQRRTELDMPPMPIDGSVPVVVRELKYNLLVEAIALVSRATGETLWRAERGSDGELLSGDVRADLDQMTATITEEVIVRVTRPAAQTLLVRTGDVAGYGYRGWDPAGADRTDEPPVTATEETAAGPVAAVLENGRVRVEVTRDGTWSINGLGGFGRIVRDGDVGDTYNWCPPEHDTVIDLPDAVEVTVRETGPVRARVEIAATYPWPEPTTVTTTLELHTGESLLRVETGWDNRTRDQRVRVHLPLPQTATTSRAECAFAVVERGLTAEGGPSEIAFPHFPSRRFVQAGGLTLAHEGLLEYELVDIAGEHDAGGGAPAAQTLALTLARCTGMLSQIPMRTRPLPAGPLNRLEGPQLRGPIKVRYALTLDPDADGYDVVEDAFVPLIVTRAGGGTEPTSGVALEVELGTAKVSALRRTDGGRLELRVHNPSSTATNVGLPARTGWLVDLRGRATQRFEGTVEVGPWRIATAVLD